MLIGILCVLASAGSVLICAAVGGFESLHWLWLLPAGLLGSFVTLVLICFIILLIACAFVDPDKEREKDSKFFRIAVRLVVEALLTVARARVHTSGLEKTPAGGRFLLVCNHLHEADPVVLLHYFRKSQLAFVGKKETKNMFLVGKIMPMLLCPYINRENDREALKTILRCIHLLREDKVSIGVFPEGYIRPDRKFHHLRPGVFKIAQKVKVPIVVCTMTNTNHLIKNFLKGRPTDIDLHLLEVIPAEWLEGKNTVEIADYIHGIMAEDLGEAYRPAEENT